MIDYLTSFEFTSFLAMFVYWIPASICLLVYFFRGVKTYKIDLANCGKEYYSPKLTVGLIVWWIVCSITPAGNLLALVFDCASSVCKWLGAVLDIPLVPKRSTENT